MKRFTDAVRRELGSPSIDDFRLYELIWQRTVASQMAVRGHDGAADRTCRGTRR